MNVARWCCSWLFLVCLCAQAQDASLPIYHLQVFADGWTLLTNEDYTVQATDHSISRDGNEVYNRVWRLKPVVIKSGVSIATPAAVRAFIHDYRPPPIAYTTPARARQKGTETFECMEFANDIVVKAASNNIASEIVGIQFENQPVGHACAGFPTTDGNVLFYDSTPSEYRISRHAYEAYVTVGQPYRRADGAEVGDGLGRTPISDIVPVSGLVASGPQYLDPPKPLTITPNTIFIVENEDRVQVPGILYDDTNGFTVSQAQIDQWNETLAAIREKKKKQQEVEISQIDDESARTAARVLRNTERAAAEGDTFAELRMGQRYREGDGVPKDLDKARKFLQQAADQGSPTAVEELLHLPR